MTGDAIPGQEPAGTPQGAEHLGSEVGRVAGRLRTFVSARGGTGSAVVQYLGRPGFRIVVVAADGTFADAVVSGQAQADAVCQAAGIPAGTWTRDLTSRITISPADRTRMAGTGR